MLCKLHSESLWGDVVKTLWGLHIFEKLWLNKPLKKTHTHTLFKMQIKKLDKSRLTFQWTQAYSSSAEMSQDSQVFCKVFPLFLRAFLRKTR